MLKHDGIYGKSLNNLLVLFTFFFAKEINQIEQRSNGLFDDLSNFSLHRPYIKMLRVEDIKKFRPAFELDTKQVLKSLEFSRNGEILMANSEEIIKFFSWPESKVCFKIYFT